MLGVVLFIAFWVLLAAAVFFLAGRRPAGERRERLFTYRGSRALGVSMVVLYIAFGVAVPLLFLHGNHANANAQVGGNKLTAAEKRGREIFAFRCGFCHTLAAANATGKVGPEPRQAPASLQPRAEHDQQRLSPQRAVANSPQQCLGEGVMPAQIIQGRDAADVAAFVAKVAGRE